MKANLWMSLITDDSTNCGVPRTVQECREKRMGGRMEFRHGGEERRDIRNKDGYCRREGGAWWRQAG
eukprot:5736271-Pyramimonas_sp.AAC.1